MSSPDPGERFVSTEDDILVKGPDGSWRPLAEGPPPAGPAAFAHPDHAGRLRGRDGEYLTVTHHTPLGDYEEVVSPGQAKGSLSDEALEALLDEVVEEAVLRKAKDKEDPLEYD